MSSIFLSHNSKDKPFVRKLANDLRRDGYYVWLDEAEIKLGDSLIEKIREGIDKVQYVGVLLSNNSINSEWVKREVDIAMNQEIEGKRVKVLPIMLDKVDPPWFLTGKLYADFTSEKNYKEGLRLIKERLDEVPIDLHKNSITVDQAKAYKEALEDLRRQLDVTRGEKRMLLERLEKERETLPESLRKSIVDEKNIFPELDDINRNFAFDCKGIPVTAGYIMHAMRKESIKGGPHQIVLICNMYDKEDELALLVEAIVRRFKSISLGQFEEDQNYI